MQLREYLEQKERNRRNDAEILSESKQLLMLFQEDREEWDKKARWGRQVQRYDFSFMDQYLGNKKKTTQVWGINFVATNIAYSIAAMVASEIKVSLKSETRETSTADRLLEAKLNYTFDKFRILRESDQALWDCEYTGMGYGVTGWDPARQTSMWFNGSPDYRILRPEDVWIDSATRKKNKSDRRHVFYREMYTTSSIRSLSPKLHDMVDDHFTNLDAERDDGKKTERPGMITVYHHLYLQTFNITRRAIINEENPKVKWVLEEEWEEAIAEMTNRAELDEAEWNELKTLGEVREETDILPENIHTTQPRESKLDFWFEVMFIPELDILINKPLLKGTRCPVSIIAGNYDPHSAYSFSNAWKMKLPFEMSIVNMTIQFFDTVKKNKPVIGIIPGSILNEKEVREKWGSPNLVIQYNAQFFEKHPTLNPSHAVYVVDMPKPGQMQILLDEKLKQAASESQVTPDVTKGIQPYAQMPANSIARLQQAAAVGAKNSYIEYEDFIENTCEVLKEDIIDKVDYKHKMLAPSETGERGMQEINSESDNMLANAWDSIVEIVLEENSEIAKTIRMEKMMMLYDKRDEMNRPMITSEDFIRGVIPADADRLIKNKMQILESSPEIMSQLFDGQGGSFVPGPDNMPPNGLKDVATPPIAS